MWWAFDGFCLLLLLCLINRYYFVAQCGGCFVCWTLRLPVGSSQSRCLSGLRH
jgi:hypothetical protein